MGKLPRADAIGRPQSGDLQEPLALPSPLLAKQMPLAAGVNI
jgi:hypothetical protein